MKNSLTIELDPELTRRLEHLAASTERSQDVLVEEALKDYLELQEWQLGAIQQAIVQDDAGQSISHEEVKKQVEEWE